MGHRTLLAYERANDYDLHRAHWGVDPETITVETPFGGPPDDAWARRRAEGLLDPAGGELTERNETAVDPEPIADGIGFEAVLGAVDPIEHEALYVVDSAWNVRTYLVFDVGGCRNASGAIVRHDDATDAAYLRGWLAGARAVRETNDVGDEAVVRALRWLDPSRGVVVWFDGECSRCS